MAHPIDSLNRRSFVRVLGSATAAASVAGVATAAPTANSPAETTVRELYASLSESQRSAICLDFNDPLRSKIGANWHVTPQKIGDDFYSDAQRELIRNVIRGVTTDEGYERFDKQMTSDHDGIENYSIAIFGDPTTKEFQWELTGRHLTMRADGNSVAGAAFGGPLVYGHGIGNPKRNLFSYQTKAANEVFAALDADQAKKALLKKIPGEHSVELKGNEGRFQGINVAEMSSDQKELVLSTIQTIIAPYREEDVQEAMSILENNGGADQLRMAFYQEGDLLKDKVWDMWRIEGPNLVCHFRGAPHVHAFINIGVKG